MTDSGDDKTNRPPSRPRRQPQREAGSSSGDQDFGRFVSDASRRFSFDRDANASARQTRGDEEEATPPPPPPDEPEDPPRSRNNPLPFALAGAVIALLLGVFAFQQFGGDDQPPPTPTEQPVTAPTETAPPPTSEPTREPTNTPPPTETPEPTRDLSASELGAQCQDGCIVRLPATDESLAAMRDHQDQEAFRAGNWLWAIASFETIASLDLDGTTVELLSTDPSTLNLYVTNLPEGQSDFSVLNGFGEIVDTVDRTAIVRVPTIPAQVRGLANAGIDVQKFAPATELDLELDTEKPQLEETDLGNLIGMVDENMITEHITDLQASSSTDGSGIGTRQYLQPGNVMAAEYLFSTLAGYGLTVRYQDFITPEGTLASNIIAELPGRDPGAIYGLMAHFDSTSDFFSVAPGADDNATGLAAVLEIARILSRYELEHPVHFILVNAEETGIIGSRVFANQARVDEIPYEGIFNLDSIGSNRRGSLIWLNSDAESEWMMALIERVNDAYGFGQDIQSRQNPQIVADDNRLREQGFESILVARELFGESPYHHTQDDVLSTVSIPNTTSMTQLMLVTVGALVVP